jgi:hypothetical protein
VIRHPVDRIYSNYRFAYSTFSSKGPFDAVLAKGLFREDKFGTLRDMITNGTSDEDIINYYYNTPFISGQFIKREFELESGECFRVTGYNQTNCELWMPDSRRRRAGGAVHAQHHLSCHLALPGNGYHNVCS